MLGGKLPEEAVTIDLDELRKDCWLGVPHKLRPVAWRILSVRMGPDGTQLNFGWHIGWHKISNLSMP